MYVNLRGYGIISVNRNEGRAGVTTLVLQKEKKNKEKAQKWLGDTVEC